MTLTQLKDKIKNVNMQGMAPLSTEQLVTYQEMAFDWILKLCEPLNLVVHYEDDHLYKSLDDGFFLKKPVIATEENQHIDIDERLDMAFVYIIVHFLGLNKTAGIKRMEASRLVLEYSIDVTNLGYSKAKKIYEKESFVNKVNFDCMGKFYEVDEDFIKTVIACILCDAVCIDASQSRQLEKYKKYLAGEVLPLDREKLVALDDAVFNYLMSNVELLIAYSETELERVTTRFVELCKLSEGDSVSVEVEALNKRLLSNACCEKNRDVERCVDE